MLTLHSNFDELSKEVLRTKYSRMLVLLDVIIALLSSIMMALGIVEVPHNPPNLYIEHSFQPGRRPPRDEGCGIPLHPELPGSAHLLLCNPQKSSASGQALLSAPSHQQVMLPEAHLVKGHRYHYLGVADSANKPHPHDRQELLSSVVEPWGQDLLRRLVFYGLQPFQGGVPASSDTPLDRAQE